MRERPGVAAGQETPRLTVRGAFAAFVACVALAGLVVLASPQGASASSGDDGAPQHAEQSRFYAERLRESPVYVSDQVPRAVPRSARGDFVAQVERVDVPMYVLVVPFSVSQEGRQLLDSVQRRLGKKGVYVLLEAGGSSRFSLRQQTYGVDVPAEEAARTSGEWLPRDASALDRLTHFVDGVLADGDGSGSGDESSSFYTSHDTRAAHSITLGVLTAVVVVGLLFVGIAVWLHSRRFQPRVWSPLLGAVVLALFIPLGARELVTETRASGAKDPTSRDMDLRAERVADALRNDGPVYVDEETVPMLSAGQQRSLRERLGELDVPVHVVALPFGYEDESYARARVFAERLQQAYGKPGLYVVAEGSSLGRANLVLANHGAPLASEELMDLDDSIRFGERVEPDRDAGEERFEASQDAVYERLTKLVDHIEDTPPGPPGRAEPPLEVPDPVERNTLDPLLSDQFWTSLRVGAISTTVLGAVVLWLWASPRGYLHPAAHGLRELVLTLRGRREYAQAPTRPRGSWLRIAVHGEMETLRRTLEEFKGADQARVQAWDCLDAATLLLDRGGEQRIDEDARTCDLATGLAMVRAGQTVLDTAGQARAARGRARLCGVNPLHGVAARAVDVAAKGAQRRSRPVCSTCAEALAALTKAGKTPDASKASGSKASGSSGASGRTKPAGRPSDRRSEWAKVRELQLPLPQGEHGGRRLVPYTEHPGLLGRAGADGEIDVARLILDVKEQLGVHS